MLYIFLIFFSLQLLSTKSLPQFHALNASIETFYVFDRHFREVCQKHVDFVSVILLGNYNYIATGLFCCLNLDYFLSVFSWPPSTISVWSAQICSRTFQNCGGKFNILHHNFLHSKLLFRCFFCFFICFVLNWFFEPICCHFLPVYSREEVFRFLPDCLKTSRSLMIRFLSVGIFCFKTVNMVLFNYLIH